MWSFDELLSGWFERQIGCFVEDKGVAILHNIWSFEHKLIFGLVTE